MDRGRVDLIRVPRWYHGIRPNEQGTPRKFCLLAFDTETVRGYPYTLQTTADGEHASLHYLTPRQFLPALVRFVEPHVRRAGGHSQVVLAGFNLGYDLPAVLYPYADRFADDHFTIQLPKLGASLEVFYAHNPFAVLRFPHASRGGCRTVWIVDLFAFVGTSLARAAELYNLPVRKLPRPKGLGVRVLRSRAFRDYAVEDAKATWHLGQRVLDWHRKFDLRLCVSIAQFSGRIFQHGFLHHAIRRPPDAVLLGALLSYHGGKNGFYLERPAWIERAKEYDVRSAYPWAMAQLPSMSEGRWEPVRYVHPGHAGFYAVTGRVLRDRYPILYDHEFRPVRSGIVQGLWVTGYELQEALRAKELELESVEGWLWVPRSKDRPLRKFVRHFYRMKSQARTPEEREVYKLILNTLYGKFIQLNPNDDGTERPGSLFHPVLASWITGMVRARMHRLEHEAGALHTATDAIHTTKTIPTRHGLGGLELVQDGPALLLRNKVYLHFDRKGTSCKFALHGIHLKGPEALWKRLVRGAVRYRITHLLRPREALARGDRLLRPVYQTFRVTLRLPAEPIPDAARHYFRMRAVPTAEAIRFREEALLRAAKSRMTANRRAGQWKRADREFLAGYEQYLRELEERQTMGREVRR